MKTLTSRPYKGEIDLEAIAQLLNSSELVHQFHEWPSPAEMLMQLETPSVDKQRDICLWEDSNSQVMAIAGLIIPEIGADIAGILWFRVDPNAQGNNLEVQILEWGEKRMREVGRERNVKVKVLSGGHSDNVERIALLESCGFAIERYFLTMERSLTDPIPEAEFPEGFTLKHIENEADAAAWTKMFNQTFIDHWNHQDITVESVKNKLNDPKYRSELSLVAVAPDGIFAAFCDCQIHPENNELNKRKDGLVSLLGTRSGFRKRGLGRGILLSALKLLKTEGMETAMLYVDADNLSGATRLYESVGFQRVNTQIAYIKEV
ncbi:MAG: GNAT family N-acetyltransferase [Okeania sp. SIO2G4]|nr:GNAT family N-acetyltransferase [Okeania sp. SIO4D6]NEP74306.1 GNAT family N-acetyltransferase [Okeania sp. SIO2G5]NEP96422.1 GNAT family N-acetyltransferase [Okeania sp. SIO2F5]NEQ93117.1 GNAT family N-acetyltransferase [Okeania sp. SIO2G4]